MRHSFRQWLWTGFALLALGMGSNFSSSLTSNVFGQNQNPAPAGGTAPAPGGVTTVNQSNDIVEWGMVIVMFGGALFAVCRSSRRN
ncbi:MAG: hypothetical protein ACKV2Q_01190 [Planctomycetaceae bacterium]